MFARIWHLATSLVEKYGLGLSKVCSMYGNSGKKMWEELICKDAVQGSDTTGEAPG
jgi:hypothetical protein